MLGLIKKYEKAIEELEERIEFYQCAKVNDEKELKDFKNKILFYKAKKETLEEVLQGKDINMYF